ncbi:hypothetical protein BJV85_003216 [Clostridium acetobutylicum]|uniref:Uncharacterized conserved protein of probably eukaryotic origin n=1 Tax=Clostridium acetobutylicum (strain ATCC 824 / DSM 792 / JCM 1419 / IAM 19013 / LMG 5710 / NBRC 13948 / NRRL B-527 / VKM B-1787 / 2291 / W) TaxID=272562 RepID=Q97KX3_CLOAB|nr:MULTISPECIES: Vps62-related protein [Clostridium]AAK78769.1 Uncharacterized conserved protein of probably eukaryotic origin [Clostridium acetobutylicum ATCC 824]ADZ19843.1 Conserved hypothetical protein [Clostridium acetobutylicum EA 2018]AEI31443.1 hypothetical protein SMB_G0809 [Clostridium acetobutylicum DSM 1731]AWV80487.1 DUF946 domain-containing protein [Clostridium acetobutylicum]MBC2392677.1 Vps62-related protein [Clostridium acetobutylicum]
MSEAESVVIKGGNKDKILPLEAEEKKPIKEEKNKAVILSNWIIKYAPIVYFHPDEKCFPITVEEFLECTDVMNEKNEKFCDGKEILSGSFKDALGNQKFYLKITDTSVREGNLNSAKCYVYVRKRNKGRYLDLQYFFFYGYNGPTINIHLNKNKKNYSTSNIGENYGNWEHVTVVIDSTDGSILGAIFDQHGKSCFYDIDQLEYEKGHIVVYSALSSHASYPSAGKSVTEYDSQELGVPPVSVGIVKFELHDATDKGRRWDTSLVCQLVSYNITGTEVEEPKWMAFNGRWGKPYDLTDKDISILYQISRLPAGGKVVDSLLWRFIPYSKKNINQANGIKSKDDFNIII